MRELQTSQFVSRLEAPSKQKHLTSVMATQARCFSLDQSNPQTDSTPCWEQELGLKPKCPVTSQRFTANLRLDKIVISTE